MRKKSRNRKNNPAELPTPPVPETGKLVQLLDMPPTTMSGMPQLELFGNREAIIDGCQGILEYDENVIRLTTGKMSIKFTGRTLQIKVLTHDSAVVSGFITNIEFII